MHVNVSTHAPFTPQGRVRPIGAYGYAALYAQRGKELRHFVRLLRVPLAIPQLTTYNRILIRKYEQICEVF